MTYSSLHGHSDFSNLRLLDCISPVSAILDRAHELGLYAVAITDHECLASFVKAEKYLAKKKKENPDDTVWQNMKFIRGNELYLCRDGLNKDTYERGTDRYFHCILLAKDKVGYQQLCELSSRAWKRMYKHYQWRVPTYYSDIVEVVGKNPGHLVLSTACLGSAINSKFLQLKEGVLSRGKAFDFGVAWIKRMKEIFGSDNVFIELQPGVSPDQIFCNQCLLELAMITNTPSIITTDHHYTKAKDRKIHKAYLQSKHGDREVDAFYEATYMMDVNEIQERMAKSFNEGQQSFDLVNAMLANTNRIADMCEDYSLQSPLNIPYLPTDYDKIFIDPDNILMKQVREIIPNLDLFLLDSEYCNRQFAMRIYYFMLESDKEGETPRYLHEEKCDRMNIELGIVWESGKKQDVHWSKYLLQVSDYLQIFWTEGDTILAPSRGSAGASYSCHALGINQIDPTREKAPLLFQRFINPDRASVLDIDSDVQSNRRDQCIQALVNKYNEERVTRVSTFKTEKARSAILTAARSLDVDIDTARYISSLCKAQRGIPYTLTQMYYGDIEEELAPNAEFVKQMKIFPDLWEVAAGIEGLVNGLGCHAGGVIITEEPIVEHCAIMRTSSGDIVTAYDLHEAEDLGLIKIDLLATESLSKIRTCLDLLVDYGYVEKKGTLKETYESVIGVYALERDDLSMWERVWNNEIVSLFQMEQQSGVQGVALSKPRSLEDLATLNSVIRLMPPDKNSERPLEKFARFKKNPYDWDYEMDEYGLTEEEKVLMHKMFDYSNGIAAQQEDLYQLMRSEAITGYGFGTADKLRKAVAKKNPQDFKVFEDQFWEDVKERGSSRQLCKYAWDVMVVPQKGYSFNLAHTFSYSIVALQEMNLAHRFPIIFWNTANLIIDSGAEFILNEDDEEENDTSVQPQYAAEEIDLEEDEEEEKKANTTSDYGKVAKAIGRMQQRGLTILPPDINNSKWTFTPRVDDDIIMYGLKGITRIGNNVVEDIIKNRPYTSLTDFLNRVKVNKTQVVALIKSGAFDAFGHREEIMSEYIDLIAEVKNQLNLRNVQMLITHGLFPPELAFEVKVFNFNKYIRKGYDKGGYLTLTETAQNFYNEYFDMDVLNVSEDGIVTLPESYWKGKYDSYMNTVRAYIKNNHDDLLNKLNSNLTEAVKLKYADGSLSHWSMESVNFYQGEHELEHADLSPWEVEDFWSLPEEPVIRNSFKSKQGHLVHMFHLNRIAGTVIDKDANKSQITLLTTGGVVTVQAYGVMSAYDKQISEVGADGKKHVVEHGWFKRGTMLIVNGMRRGESTFIAKKYSRDKGHHFMKITKVDDNGVVTVQEERVEVE